MPTATNTPSRELGSMRNRVLRAAEAFARGEAILVGDDGRRENEADLVFHAAFATPELVNLAIRKACGLLCVSIAHELADRLGIPTAPKWPGGMAHTGFTLSVDARNNITSGISARDRAQTIALLADPQATNHDFLSPGHVFPVRAQDGGLLARTGHTEAVMELCALTSLPGAAAMCEILDSEGDALRPALLTSENTTSQEREEALWWNRLPYVSTVDLLWYRLFCAPRSASAWKPLSSESVALTRSARKVFKLVPQLEASVVVPCTVAFYSEDIQPTRVRIRIHNGFREWTNQVSVENAQAEVILFIQNDCAAPTPQLLSDFCDLSAKEGLHGTQVGVRRVLTQLRAFDLLVRESAWGGSQLEWMAAVDLPVASDKELLIAAREL